jgi:hypothetical protein
MATSTLTFCNPRTGIVNSSLCHTCHYSEARRSGHYHRLVIWTTVRDEDGCQAREYTSGHPPNGQGPA